MSEPTTVSTQTDRATLPLYVAIARTLAWNPPETTPPAPDFRGQRARRLKMFEDMLPSGTGWDSLPFRPIGQPIIDLDRSTPDKIVLYGSYHHMNDVGMYDGWTDHTIIIRPSLQWDFNMRITGRDRNEIKDYLHEMFDDVLRGMVPAFPEHE